MKHTIKTKETQFSYYKILPLLFTMIVIFLLSDQPGDTMPQTDFDNFDKICHVIAYGILAATYLFAFGQLATKKSQEKIIYITTILFCILYGVSDEFHQSFVPQRTPSALDVLADGVGALLYTTYSCLRNKTNFVIS